MRSFIDPNHTMSERDWVISLVAKPRGKNPEHAFIIVEGLGKDKSGTDCAMFCRYDFVVELPQNIAPGSLEQKVQIIKRHPGIVVIKEKSFAADDEDLESLFWTAMLKDVNHEEGCQGLSWPVSKDAATVLHTQHLAAQQNPPDYQLSGQHSFFAASSSQNGHNCYTFSRQQLLALNCKMISDDKRLSVSLHDLFAARTTRHLKPPVEKQKEPSSLGCSMM